MILNGKVSWVYIMLSIKNNGLIYSYSKLWINCVLAGVLLLVFIQKAHGVGQTGSEDGETFGKAIIVLSAVYAASNEDAKSSECKSANWQTYDIPQLIAEEFSLLKPEYKVGQSAKKLDSVVNSIVAAPYKVQNGTTLAEITRLQAHKGADNYVKALKDLAPLTRCDALPSHYELWINNLQERMRPYQKLD
ncbi:MAG: hypothetical protein JAY74_05685 [Candidatus Thiodiazotropha taylori]|nr:hypothetical protein [Candidatus Thiodiazotropha taylori]